MRVLVVKMSSMGDVLHTLPALTDAQAAISNIHFDWVVEPGFSEIPRWHRAVHTVISLPLRRWRHEPWRCWRQGEISRVMRLLRQSHYDLIIDAQGLCKSAIVASVAKGPRVGFDVKSAREKWVALTYHQAFHIPQQQHAVERIRQLFASALGYCITSNTVDYGIDPARLVEMPEEVIVHEAPYIIFLHGTTWHTKHWPEAHWVVLAQLANRAGYRIKLPWGNQAERERAERVAQEGAVEVLPKTTLSQMARIIKGARGVVAVDTGLGHVAAAMAVPTVSLYGPTNPALTGAYGPFQTHATSSRACAPCLSRRCTQKGNFTVAPPCFGDLSPTRIWDQLLECMNEYSKD